MMAMHVETTLHLFQASSHFLANTYLYLDSNQVFTGYEITFFYLAPLYIFAVFNCAIFLVDRKHKIYL